MKDTLIEHLIHSTDKFFDVKISPSTEFLSLAHEHGLFHFADGKQTSPILGNWRLSKIVTCTICLEILNNNNKDGEISTLQCGVSLNWTTFVYFWLVKFNYNLAWISYQMCGILGATKTYMSELPSYYKLTVTDILQE